MLEKCVLTILELNWNQRLGHKKTKLNICHHMLTSSTQLQNRSFHVVERTRTSSNCQKMKNARAKRAKILFFIVKYANLWGFCCRRGCLISLTTTWNFHIRGSDDIASSQLQIFHSLPLDENHSCQECESALRLFCSTWPTWNNRKKLNFSSILIWLFRCSNRRGFLRTFAPKSSYGEIFFIFPLELVHKVLTPKMKKKNKKKMGVTDFVSEKMAVEKCLNFDKSVVITRYSLLC